MLPPTSDSLSPGRVAPTILVVDDNPDDCFQLQRIIGQTFADAHVLVAHTAAEGLEKLYAQTPECVLLDFRLPDSNGLQVLEDLRKQPPNRYCTIVMLTGHSDEALAVSAMRAGAYDYLVKDVAGHYRNALPSVVNRALIECGEQREQEKAEQRFAQLARRHETILNSITEGIVILSPDFTILSINPAAARLYGYDDKELIGESLELLVPLEMRPAYRAAISEYWTTGKSPFISGRPVVTPGQRKGGTLCETEWSVTEVRLEGRAALAVVIRDVSERQRIRTELHETTERFREAFENAPIGVALVTPEGRFLRVNTALCDIVGYSGDELLKLSFDDITHPDDQLADLQLASQLLAGELRSYQMEKRYVHKQGHDVWILLSVSLVRDGKGEPLYFVSQIQDITERKNLERQKGEFLAMVSHELRTPLTAIRGALSLMANGAAGELPQKAKKLAAMGQRNAERLSHLIADILDMEKIEAGGFEYHMRAVELHGLIQGAVEELSPYADQFNVKFGIEPCAPELWVQGDPDRLSQVLANLLSNAAKFSSQGDVVVVRTSIVDQRARVAVIDRGSGIPEDFQRSVFNKFAQADPLGSDRKGGTGLGLAISKAIVEQHGGVIAFESRLSEGSTFYFDLDVITAPVETPASEVPAN